MRTETPDGNEAWRISPLEYRRADAEKVAAWIASEWGRLPIHEYFLAMGRGDAWASLLPRTLVAHVGRDAVGTVSVLLNDLETRPEFNPWLGCLYVERSWRGRGIGMDLLRAAEMMASSQLSITRLYLFTDSQADLYARHGWSAFDHDVYLKKPVSLMTKRL